MKVLVDEMYPAAVAEALQAAGIEEPGRQLLTLLNDLGPEAEHDRERVDRWARQLGLVRWYRWVPVQ